jgi:hypothetical protein
MLERNLRTPSQGRRFGSSHARRPLATIRRLDGRRKGDVIRFLDEAGLLAP